MAKKERLSCTDLGRIAKSYDLRLQAVSLNPEPDKGAASRDNSDANDAFVLRIVEDEASVHLEYPRSTAAAFQADVGCSYSKEDFWRLAKGIAMTSPHLKAVIFDVCVSTIYAYGSPPLVASNSMTSLTAAMCCRSAVLCAVAPCSLSQLTSENTGYQTTTSTARCKQPHYRSSSFHLPSCL